MSQIKINTCVRKKVMVTSYLTNHLLYTTKTPALRKCNPEPYLCTVATFSETLMPKALPFLPIFANGSLIFCRLAFLENKHCPLKSSFRLRKRSNYTISYQVTMRNVLPFPLVTGSDYI